MTLWTSAEAAAATGGQTGDWVATGVSIDTRTIQPGDLFVALRDVRDGHEFVAQALEKGAAAALVSHVPDGVSPDRLLIVKDVLQGLEALGVAARARCKGRVAAITGSVGKTSTKEMLRTVLERQGKCHAAEASYNNHWGVPLTLARMPADTDYAIIEIGMSNPGEIAPLSRMVRPHVAMVTTVAAAHLASFDSLAGIATEKAAIIDGLEPGGVAVLNADIETSSILRDHADARAARQLLFGETAPDWTLRDVRLNGDVTVIRATGAGQDYLFKLSVAGRHFATNAVGVLAVVDALGADPVTAALDMALWVPPAGRGTRETIVIDEATDGESLALLDDSFNANPTSLTAALEVLAAAQPVDNVGRVVKGRRIAILGDMLELGGQEVQMHRDVATNAYLQELDLVHCVGPLMHHLWQALPDEQRGQWAQTASELAARTTGLVDCGDVVLVKGSKGSKVSLVVDAIRKLGHRRPLEE
ncbi:UDP-N-acetylmuramoyl-tripeptide--D-alanyl-D-alanine ligase [Yoonia sediminilitoris]|uniref:UDP-N-acetylmuramoyl-tripeptide--D-alanyl-D-alanine ligase n=1 Tax=Yoonia sediminilitoris TaxID=1286148 RepID=A0A2T6KEN1_9RHOB|nr:UDP-N-acetylmuramoyl-tripeptide--D-alanyl-D-alanine ligase [Yoonia sediminilitoris]PUB13586.1 UDP-N-acetylmuramoyl-tripeptide--D-alanyl-D-alanine ligase [Yoonia sediminilitoris]RCW94756.1 UDP-N-acetylmuramoyl-tripeptide--D-alanyl-D-alanine ligase [Yoonia sediminilitoris]